MAVRSIGKWLYGAVFVLFLPAALVAWAAATANMVHIRTPAVPWFGLVLASIGIVLVVLGMAHLWMYGGGLPMNAYPPPRYVVRGIYGLLPHPIYTGFSVVCAGVSIVAGSASGLWLITPLVTLGSVALVLGYERHDLRARFGSAARPFLPREGSAPATISERLSCYMFVLLPWLLLYEAVIAIGPPPDAIQVWFPLEKQLPVVEWSEVVYASAYIWVGLAPLFARRSGDLRTFCVRGLGAMAIAFPFYLAIPLMAPPRPFTPQTVPGRLLSWERTFDGPAGAFPSFHVIWAVLTAQLFAARWPGLAWLWRCWALLIAVSCVTTGQHPLLDVLGAFATVELVESGGALWRGMRRQAERIANSWKEWRFGPVRLINHGVYAGLGASIAVWIAVSVAGPRSEAAILVAAFIAVTGAALWAQYVEGSQQLLRPFGFYGGLLGGTVGALIAPLFGASAWLVLGAFSAAGPWAQAMGRLRCLVQGCCHGRPASDAVGIRYVHPRSRVCRLTAWSGVPLHATPVYSILWNGVIAVVVTRLWILHAPLHLICGLYFMLTGLGRFVEEAWRGEPQTPIFARLRLYQWAAVASIVAGALMTALGKGRSAPDPRFEWSAALSAIGFGLLVCCAMGADLPNSQRRFSRLA